MTGKREVYASEFKIAAVKTITEQKLSVAEVARRLGVTENRLLDWKKAVHEKGADASRGPGISRRSKKRTASCGSAIGSSEGFRCDTARAERASAGAPEPFGT